VSRRALRIRRACRPAIQRYVAMSRDIAAWIERDVGVPRARIRQIYSGVDTSLFRPDGPVPADVPWDDLRRDELLVLGTVGRLDPIKNQIALVEALQRIGARQPALGARLRLIVAGDGPERGRLEEAARRLTAPGQVWFAGARNDIPDLLRAMDLFVLPSLNEGVSNTLLEAMASAVPVVAARVGGNPELIADGETGVLCEAASAESLATCLSAYLADAALLRAHGLAARRRTCEEFSLEAMIGRYERFYDELVGRTGN
jgi:sugar transferase (PEP-CTERM/EpsH1 system associated)